MKTLTTLFSKVFRSQKATPQMTEAELDAWIVSIRQKPQYSDFRCDDLRPCDESENLVLA